MARMLVDFCRQAEGYSSPSAPWWLVGEVRPKCDFPELDIPSPPKDPSSESGSGLFSSLERG